MSRSLVESPPGTARGDDGSWPSAAGVRRRSPVDPAWLILGAAACWVVWLLWGVRGYTPIWDARVYADCAVRAAVSPSLGVLRCAEHPSHAYIAILSLGQRISPGSTGLLLATNGLLLLVLAIAFGLLLQRAFPDRALGIERAMLVAVLVTDPVVVAGAVQVNPDFGVLVFLACSTAALVGGHMWTTVLFGILAAFSKESGALLYGGVVAAYGLSRILPVPVPRAVRNSMLGAVLAFAACMLLMPWAVWTVPAAVLAASVAARLCFDAPMPLAAAFGSLRRLRPLAPLALPLVMYASYLAWRSLAPQVTAPLWGGHGGGWIVRTLLFPQLSPGVRAYLALIFVVNFHWVMTVPLAIDAAVGIGRNVRRLAPRTVAGARPDVTRFIVLGSCFTIYLVTRFPTAIIARYMMPVYPLVLTAVLAAMLRLRVPGILRRATLAAVLLLFALSMHRTRDPVSRALWGTFPFGSHEILDINSKIDLCCGYQGMDETVYNLEFVPVATLTQQALTRLHPARDRVLAADALADWNIVGPLDASSRRRLWGTSLRAPTLVHVGDLSAGRVVVDTAWYLETAHVDVSSRLPDLMRTYRIGTPDTLWQDGYALVLRRITR